MSGMSAFDARLASLPAELAFSIATELPKDKLDAVLGQRRKVPIRSNLQVANNPLLTNPSSCPILKLPFELRRNIYKYLLPDKQKKIEPKAYAATKAHLYAKQSELDRRRNEALQNRQNQAQTVLNAQATWFPAAPAVNAANATNAGNAINANNATLTANVAPVANVGQPLPLPAPGTVASQAVTQHLHVPPTIQIPAVNQVPAGLGSANVLAQTAGNPVGGNIVPFTIPAVQLVHAPPAANVVAENLVSIAISAPGVVTSATRPVDLTDDIELQQAMKAGLPDPSAECMTLPLLCVNKLFCSEVAMVLYEEYTFEVHIHSRGTDFLHIPRIDTMETYGMELREAMNKFSPTSQFCFQRMKHLEFVLWGGDPKDRTAAIRIQETVRKLVEMFKEENEPLRFLVRTATPPATIVVHHDRGNTSG
jgi:hypothetical protein